MLDWSILIAPSLRFNVCIVLSTTPMALWSSTGANSNFTLFVLEKRWNFLARNVWAWSHRSRQGIPLFEIYRWMNFMATSAEVFETTFAVQSFDIYLLQLRWKRPNLAHQGGARQSLIVPPHQVLQQVPFGMSVYFLKLVWGFYLVLYNACSFASARKSTDVCAGTIHVHIDPAWLQILNVSNVGCRALSDAAV